MKARLLNVVAALGASLWPIPLLFALGAVALVLGMQAADGVVVASDLPRWLQTGSRSDARQLLAAVFQAVLGAMGITFSITIAVLSLAASNYGPRILRNFTADRGAQVVLGIFAGTSLYGLTALPLMEAEGVPHLTAATGTLLGVTAIGALVWFVHHVAVMVQADVLATGIASDLVRAVDRLFPARPGGDRPPEDEGPPELPDFESGGRSVAVRRSGYVQAVSEERLIEAAAGADVVLRLRRRPGDYLVIGTEIADVFPGAKLDDRLAGRIRAAFVLGRQRTPEQDLEFIVHELVEMALRAVSPAVNDPYMAMATIDRLAEGLGRLAATDAPDPLRYDDASRLRLVADPFTFPEMLDAAFDLVRHYAEGNRLVLRRLLEAVRLVAPHVRNGTDREALRAQIRRIRSAAVRSLAEPEDRARVESEVKRTFDDVRRWEAVNGDSGRVPPPGRNGSDEGRGVGLGGGRGPGG